MVYNIFVVKYITSTIVIHSLKIFLSIAPLLTIRITLKSTKLLTQQWLHFKKHSHYLILNHKYILLYSCQFRVNHNSSTILTNNYFLAKFNIHLSLWWNFIKATATCVALDIYNTKTVTSIFTNSLE